MTETVGELGEFGIIADVIARLPQSGAVILGPGDDAAVVSMSGRVVVTTDMMIENRHFRREWSSAYDVGRKAAARSMSDVLAMGGIPIAIVTAIALPASTPRRWVVELTDGLRDECQLTDASVVGGDFSHAEQIMLTVTALGSLPDLAVPVTRAGARPGDTIVVTGRLGWASAGLELLGRGIGQPQVVLDAHRRPQLPYDAQRALLATGPHAMCDVSDGLVQDLGHIAAASGVRINLHSESIPLGPELQEAGRLANRSPLDWALTGGDDYALVACLAPGTAVPEGCVVIGTVETGAGVFVDGRPHSGPGGHDHFR